MSIALVASIAAAQRRKPIPTAPSAPTLVSSTVNGSTLTDVYSAAVSFGAGGNGGKTLSMSGGASSPTYSSGAGTTTIVYSLSRAIAFGETGTSGYTQPGNGLEATSGGADVATYSGASVTNTTSGGGDISTDFDALYSGGFALDEPSGVEDNVARTARAKPAKMSSLATAAYINDFGVREYRLTAVGDSPDSVASMRHIYSRQQAFSCDNKRLIAVAGNGYWYLYDTDTGARLVGNKASGAGVGSLAALVDVCEPMWHPTESRSIIHTIQYGGLVYYKLDVTTPSAPVQTTFFDLGPKLAALGAPWNTATRAWTDSEGRPSNDFDVWTFMLYSSLAPSSFLGFCAYRRSTDTIIWKLATTNRPNHLSTSPNGDYAVISWTNYSGQTIAQCEAAPVSSCDGVRAYDLNDPAATTFTQLNSTGEHSDTALAKNGDEVFVSVAFDGAPRDPWATVGGLYYKRLSDGALVNLPSLLNVYTSYASDSVVYGLHISGLCSDIRRGWAAISFYGEGGGIFDCKSNAVVLVELTPTSPRVLRLAYTNNDGVNYINEAQVCASYDGTRFVWGAMYQAGAFNAANACEDYMVGLPSWAIPA